MEVIGDGSTLATIQSHIRWGPYAKKLECPKDSQSLATGLRYAESTMEEVHNLQADYCSKYSNQKAQHNKKHQSFQERTILITIVIVDVQKPLSQIKLGSTKWPS